MHAMKATLSALQSNVSPCMQLHCTQLSSMSSVGAACPWQWLGNPHPYEAQWWRHSNAKRERYDTVATLCRLCIQHEQ